MRVMLALLLVPTLLVPAATADPVQVQTWEHDDEMSCSESESYGPVQYVDEQGHVHGGWWSTTSDACSEHDSSGVSVHVADTWIATVRRESSSTSSNGHEHVEDEWTSGINTENARFVNNGESSQSESEAVVVQTAAGSATLQAPACTSGSSGESTWTWHNDVRHGTYAEEEVARSTSYDECHVGVITPLGWTTVGQGCRTEESYAAVTAIDASDDGTTVEQEQMSEACSIQLGMHVLFLTLFKDVDLTECESSATTVTTHSNLGSSQQHDAWTRCDTGVKADEVEVYLRETSVSHQEGGQESVTTQRSLVAQVAGNEVVVPLSEES